MKKERVLTDLQKAFIAHLVGDAKGDFHAAKIMAGYSETTPTKEIVDALRDEIIQASKDVLTSNVAKAAHAIADQISNPDRPGASITARAAQEVLDRVGVVKSTGDLSVKVPEGGLVILPAKQVSPYDKSPAASDEGASLE